MSAPLPIRSGEADVRGEHLQGEGAAARKFRVQVEAEATEAAAEVQQSAPEPVERDEPAVPERVVQAAAELELMGREPAVSEWVAQAAAELEVMDREPAVPERVAQAAAERSVRGPVDRGMWPTVRVDGWVVVSDRVDVAFHPADLGVLT